MNEYEKLIADHYRDHDYLRRSLLECDDPVEALERSLDVVLSPAIQNELAGRIIEAALAGVDRAKVVTAIVGGVE